MHKLLLLMISLLMLSQTAYADREAFCQTENYANHLLKPENRMAFTNSGGLFNQGVCWWHSRFQRNSMVLAHFKPNSSTKIVSHFDFKKINQLRQQKKEFVFLEDILINMKSGFSVFEIPGFKNLRDFSMHHQKEIQTLLDYWQIEDGFVWQKWLRGSTGAYFTNPDKLEAKMHRIYGRVVAGEVTYVMQQIPGIVAHAWLITHMTPVEDGYKITYIDSNYLQVKTYLYKFGDRTMKTEKNKMFLIHPGHYNEWQSVLFKKSRYCKRDA